MSEEKREKLENKDLIHLQHCHVTLEIDAWYVRKNITGQLLYKFDRKFTEQDIFTILDFSKKFELEAFNQGAKLGKQKTVKVYEEIIKGLKEERKVAMQENERIAGILEKHIGEGD